MDLDDIGRDTESQASSTTWGPFTLPASAPSGRSSQVDDLMYVFVSSIGGNVPATPAGWTRIGNLLTAWGRWITYFRVRQSGDTTITFTLTPATAAEVLLLNIPAEGLSSIVSSSFGNIAPTPDPNPIAFADCSGGLKLAVFAGDGTFTITQANNNRWDEIINDANAAFGHLGVGPVDTFDLSTPGGDPSWGFQACISYRLHRFTLGKVGFRS